MAHCPYERLADLHEVLDEVRSWEQVQERSPGVFYLRRTPFLHFPVDKTDRRWADVRSGASWGSEIDIPFGASASVRRAFSKQVRERYL
ncbi:MAG: hypothetical protein KC729_04750, partial [Candidatus Eisenbacteria bacterium]|nr:hypothetical protein [Candidatus Eisenbacteria bacterium]